MVDDDGSDKSLYTTTHENLRRLSVEEEVEKRRSRLSNLKVDYYIIKINNNFVSLFLLGHQPIYATKKQNLSIFDSEETVCEEAVQSKESKQLLFLV